MTNSSTKATTNFKDCRFPVLLILILVSSSCSLNVNRTLYQSGNILVMPPSNAVQGGKVHPVAANSGSYIQLSVVRQLEGGSAFTAKAYTSDSQFSNDVDYKPEDAIKVAASRGFKYCLIIKLGEFRDAFPMTFRDDFVILNEAHLIDVQSKKDVWALAGVYKASGTNIGSYYPLLDELASKISKSILQNHISTGSYLSLNSYDSTSNAVISNQENDSSVDQNLEKLKALKKARQEGILTESEYQKKRKIIVDEL